MKPKPSACDAKPNATRDQLLAGGWLIVRRPKCNRPIGHELPHREHRRRDARVLWEWEQ